MSEYGEKQIQILNAAEELFAEQGFVGASVRDIAGRANVNVAMINYYFGSKERLLGAIFEYRISVTTLQLETLLSREGLDVFKKIDLIIEHYVEKHYNNKCFFKIVQAVHFSGGFSETIAEIVFQAKKKNYELIAGLITEGQRKGVFRKNVDVALLIQMLVGTGNQIIIGKDNYRRFHNMQDMDEERFDDLLRKRTKTFLKNSFKAILSHEQ